MSAGVVGRAGNGKQKGALFPGRSSLAVGYPGTGGWKETFLWYAGVPRARIGTIAEGLDRGIRVFVWNRQDPFFSSCDADCPVKIAIITDNRFLRSALGLSGHQGESYYFRLDGGPFPARSFYVHLTCEILPELGGGLGTCYDPENRRIEYSGLHLVEWKNILFLSVPWNLLDEEMGGPNEYRPFYSPAAGRHFAETGPSADFGALRRLFLELVLYAFRSLGLPLVRLRYPFAGERAFVFRVDADGFSPASTEAVLRISRSIGGARFTWFIDVQGWGRDIGQVRDLVQNGQEVELHCYHHMTYKRQAVNWVNLKMGMRRLGRYGIHPRGTASPYGFWFKGYEEAVRRLGFSYTSDFAFNCDDFPSFPYNDPAYPLQVPVHPGSIGAFEKAGFSRAEMFAHLRDTMEKAIQDCGCSLICDHPIGRIERYEEGFIDLFMRLTDGGWRCVPLSEFVERARSFLVHDFDAHIEGCSVTIESGDPGSHGYEMYPPMGTDSRFETGSPVRVCERLPDVKDEFEYPGEPGIQSILREQAKDETLTNLTLPQWCIGLTRHTLRRFLRAHGPAPSRKGSR